MLGAAVSLLFLVRDKVNIAPVRALLGSGAIAVPLLSVWSREHANFIVTTWLPHTNHGEQNQRYASRALCCGVKY